MINIVKDLCVWFDEVFIIICLEIVFEQIFVDGICKWLFKFFLCGVGCFVEVEIVYIFEEGWGILCVFFQVGCIFICMFCYIGIQKLVCNLIVEEILLQILMVCDCLGDFLDVYIFQGVIVLLEGCLLFNIVMMGMGELFYNFDNVKQVFLIVLDGDGLLLLKCCIILLIFGVVLEIFWMGDEIGCMLVIFLYVVNDELCDVLVLINKKWNIDVFLDVCWQYLGLLNVKCIIFEYVMFKGINDSNKDVFEFVCLLKGILVKINLILFNFWLGLEYECFDWEWIEEFVDIVNWVGYVLLICILCGCDIFVVCGQLKLVFEWMCKKDWDVLVVGVNQE